MRKTLGILLALAAATLPAEAQVKAGGEFIVNSYTTGYQFGPAVSAAGAFLAPLMTLFAFTVPESCGGRTSHMSTMPRSTSFNVSVSVSSASPNAPSALICCRPFTSEKSFTPMTCSP